MRWLECDNILIGQGRRNHATVISQSFQGSGLRSTTEKRRASVDVARGMQENLALCVCKTTAKKEAAQLDQSQHMEQQRERESTRLRAV